MDHTEINIPPSTSHNTLSANPFSGSDTVQRAGGDETLDPLEPQDMLEGAEARINLVKEPEKQGKPAKGAVLLSLPSSENAQSSEKIVTPSRQNISPEEPSSNTRSQASHRRGYGCFFFTNSPFSSHLY